MLHWAKGYRDLLTNAVIDPILQELLTPRYRLDHIYGTTLLLADGCAGQRLHAIAHVAGGGMYSYNAALGGFQNGMVVVALELEDILPGDGGFGCIVRSPSCSSVRDDDSPALRWCAWRVMAGGC
eukprot:COSAG01_NODE_12008_length_1817_cov_1.417928_1_plen_125_part_00